MVDITRKLVLGTQLQIDAALHSVSENNTLTDCYSSLAFALCAVMTVQDIVLRFIYLHNNSFKEDAQFQAILSMLMPSFIRKVFDIRAENADYTETAIDLYMAYLKHFHDFDVTEALKYRRTAER